MKKFNGLRKGFMGVATVACLLFAAGVTGVPYYGSVGGETVAVAKKANKSNKANKAKKISADKAKKIALGDAKLAEKDVTFVKVELEFENNRLVYDVEFYSGNVEYDYEIDAANGAILSVDKDIENYVIPTQPSKEAPTKAQVSEISVEEAKQIALSHAGVGSARFTKAKLDYENGIKVYEIEFKVGNMEYEYDINVSNGAIISSSAEIDD
ncbi:PepSY domain-containing protein [Lachnoanaerobaculum sp. Marseille-Q4761]|uniref:PepSY domain-containing protein n=1 Tax=Lachnoanaerobaculum sp. Marseille-Q4761 TaxID=2819511 RepID=UPI001AA18DD8|nr:PepSY domain-containing protein [Lachnoanaerobaculum sp. Marseille-Q4761]MBO1869624.1 PepSY domain-containing protein [Lachnoanaerobaculum sp. Marseille-Q4761]